MAWMWSLSRSWGCDPRRMSGFWRWPASGDASYTQDADFLRHHADGVAHAGIFYHHGLAYGIGEAIRSVFLACELIASEETRTRVEFL